MVQEISDLVGSEAAVDRFWRRGPLAWSPRRHWARSRDQPVDPACRRRRDLRLEASAAGGVAAVARLRPNR